MPEVLLGSQVAFQLPWRCITLLQSQVAYNINNHSFVHKYATEQSSRGTAGSVPHGGPARGRRPLAHPCIYSAWNRLGTEGYISMNFFD